MREDLTMWLAFLQHLTVFCRPFLDFSDVIIADEIDMYSDTSGKIRVGALCGSSWMHARWPKMFIQKYKPSIEYLELFGVTATVLTWISAFKNKRVILFCDNKSVVDVGQCDLDLGSSHYIYSRHRSATHLDRSTPTSLMLAGCNRHAQ